MFLSRSTSSQFSPTYLRSSSCPPGPKRSIAWAGHPQNPWCRSRPKCCSKSPILSHGFISSTVQNTKHQIISISIVQQREGITAKLAPYRWRCAPKQVKSSKQKVVITLRSLIPKVPPAWAKSRREVGTSRAKISTQRLIRGSQNGRKVWMIWGLGRLTAGESHASYRSVLTYEVLLSKCFCIAKTADLINSTDLSRSLFDFSIWSW